MICSDVQRNHKDMIVKYIYQVKTFIKRVTLLLGILGVSIRTKKC